MVNEPINPIILTIVFSFVLWLILKAIKIESDRISKKIDEQWKNK